MSNHHYITIGDWVVERNYKSEDKCYMPANGSVPNNYAMEIGRTYVCFQEHGDCRGSREKIDGMILLDSKGDVTGGAPARQSISEVMDNLQSLYDNTCRYMEIREARREARDKLSLMKSTK